jgi:1-acyl-sn-glycerol-3-phosphate acyltransferase
MSEVVIVPPKISKIQTLMGKVFLKGMGWNVSGNLPNLPKFVLICAPHTSNWDLLFMLACFYVMGVQANWMGKKAIFRWPFGSIFKWLGGIPIDRRAPQNIVQQMVQVIQSREYIIIGLAPEGTRSKTGYWKTGFYHIARESQVPIAFGFLDYGRKVGGIGPVIETTGNIEADMVVIRDFYSDITARYPDKVGVIGISPQTESQLPQS